MESGHRFQMLLGKVLDPNHSERLHPCLKRLGIAHPRFRSGLRGITSPESCPRCAWFTLYYRLVTVGLGLTLAVSPTGQVFLPWGLGTLPDFAVALAVMVLGMVSARPLLSLPAEFRRLAGLSLALLVALALLALRRQVRARRSLESLSLGRCSGTGGDR